MELLAFKVNDKYIRIKELNIELVSLNKATVYSILDKDKVSSMYEIIKQSYKELVIVKLRILEEEFL